MTPKPAYTALLRLMNALADPGPAFPLTFLDYSITTGATDGGPADGGGAGDGGIDPSVHSLLLEKRTGRFELVVWLEEESYNPNSMPPAVIAVPPVTVVLDVKTSLSSATFGTIDDTGSLAPSALSLEAGKASLTVTDHVSIVELVPAR